MKNRSATVLTHKMSVLASLLLAACSGSQASQSGGGGASSSAGGSTDLGSGGTTSAASAGGSSATLGGTPASGGVARGGSSNTGGAIATGGVNGNGGAAPTGGKAAGGALTGGTKSATGGSGMGVTTGGTKATGGAATGGVRPTGGAATGGAAPTGGSKATGGAVSTSCTFPSAWNPGSPTYTTYTLPNAQTACGYNGSNNQITNIVNPGYFAAIPGNSSTDFNTSNRCGACVQIGNAIITIVDECPFPGNAPCQANPTGHLDLSQAGASAAGVTGDPNNHNQAAWKFVPCPITGNVKVRLKNGNNNEFFIENEILPIQSVTCGSQTGSRTSYGAWHFANNVNGQSCTATDIGNRSITFTVGNTQGQDVDTGVQFPKCN